MTEESIHFGILIISDRSSIGERPDSTGPALMQRIEDQGWVVESLEIIPDELMEIRNKLMDWADTDGYDVILTSGGTGFSKRDVTPEATRAVLEKEAPGIAEAMRKASLEVTHHAMLSRAIAGIRGKTLIVNLPGSPKGAVENLAVIIPVIPHGVQLLQEDSSAEAGHRAADR